MPIFFLYFSSKLSLQDVLLLESIYYVSVVILEVPTGYFSDLIGRRTTLIIGALALVFACSFYLIGDTFISLMIGQLGFAMHMSLISGTNTVFHYESLAALHRSTEYGDREAIVNKYGSIAGGTAALLGGLLATYDMRLAYGLSLIAAVMAMIIAMRFVEPPESTEDQASKNPFKQLLLTLSFIRVKPLGWILGYFVLIYAITHVPYEFYQPYIQLLSERDMIYGLSVTTLSGLIYASARYISAFGASYSMIWSRTIGTFNFLMIAAIIITLVVAVMSSALHIIALGFVMLRSTPSMAIKAPINAIITPRIGPGQRATFHSVMSLICRLSFFLLLILLSLIVDHDALVDWDNLRLILRTCLIGAFVFLIPLALFGRRQLENHN